MLYQKLRDKESEIVELYKSGKSLTAIAKMYGSDRHTVSDFLHSLGVLQRKSNSNHGLLVKNFEEVINLYQSGWSQYRIAEHFGCCNQSVGEFLKRSSVSLRKLTLRPDDFFKKTELTPFQSAVLDGVIMTDGYLRAFGSGTRCRNSSFQVTSKFRSFAEHFTQVLPFGGSITPVRSPKSPADNYMYTSSPDRTLSEYRDHWYKDGVKIIPRDLKLHPALLRYAFYCDGSSVLRGKNLDLITVIFHLNSFTYDEVLFFADLLASIGILSVIYLERRNKLGEPQYIIRIHKQASIRMFFDYIGQCDVECFQYKFKLGDAYA